MRVLFCIKNRQTAPGTSTTVVFGTDVNSRSIAGKSGSRYRVSLSYGARGPALDMRSTSLDGRGRIRSVSIGGHRGFVRVASHSVGRTQ